MPGVAVNGSTYETTVEGYVTYEIWSYIKVGETCTSRDDDGYCTNWDDDYDWRQTGRDSRAAKITGYIVASSKMKIGGASVAVVGDTTIETWVAAPPVPSNSSGTEIRNIQPGTSGSGQGKIISGSTRGKLNGKSIALIGSTVETCLGTITTIKTGSDKMKFSS
ncbi:hypothetical protein ACE3MQ_09250 [Paenibacillus lentus]|uniref:hypothetical protein n=1 Tax=Paenibacillus lentus TaxID=1338368 RepID=UPI00364B17CD